MALFKCKMCGGDLEILEGATVAECEYCGTKQTVPKAMEENLQSLFNRANTLRLKSEFDKAERLYEKIIQADATQSEAYWGLILCKYGIEYVDDPATFKKIPTCHRTSYDSIIADEDYKAALEYADASQRALYEAQAREIDRIQKDILALAQKEEAYDIFICYKETDASGNRTQDSVIANDIYYQLKNEGFKTFYAAITLEGKLGSAYEPVIFAALNSARVMLVIGTRPEYFNAVWVKNEWSRFLKIIKNDRNKLLIPCYRDMDAYELPEEFAHLQAQDMSKIGFINDLVRGIKKVAVQNESKAVAVEEKPTVATAYANAGVNVAPWLQRAFLFLEDGDWKSANEYCEKVLDVEPRNAQAYLAKLMIELKVKRQEKLKDCAKPFDSSGNYQKVLRFGDDALKGALKGYVDHINIRNESERREKLYNRACIAMENATSEDKYKNAASLFNSLKGYRDAESLAKQCLEKAAIARREEEKRLKRNERIAAIVLLVICLVVAFVIVLNTVIIPTSRYNKAIAFIESENYIDAYETLIALDGYKDSEELAKSIYDKYKFLKLKSAKAGDCVLFGTYEQDNNTSNGEEDIEWLVLEVKDGKALVISKYALDCQPYNETYMDVTWETCTLRGWLNDEFLDVAFTEYEQEKISTVTVSADKNPSYNTEVGNETQDKVFLLSVDELNKYFLFNSDKQCQATDYAIANGVLTFNSANWWLRTPGDSQFSAAYVYSEGVNSYGRSVDSERYGVRPAMWIDLNA